MSKIISPPWFVDFNAHKSHGHCRVMGEMCTPVATVFNTVDAKLIAAAPDLLEALEKAVNRQGFSNDELIAAREVINKAKNTVKNS